MSEVVMAADWHLRLAQESHRVRLAAMRHAEGTAQRVCPVDTGDLVASIEGEADRDTMSCRLSAGGGHVNYAAVVELGGRPHEIRSHGDYPLRSKDGRVFGKVVHHPGTPAQPYLRPGVSSIAGFRG